VCESTSRLSYKNASEERPSTGITEGIRAEISLDQARSELANALSGFTKDLFGTNYGQLVGVASESIVEEFLIHLESRLEVVRGGFEIVFGEILERFTAELFIYRRNCR
jgi:hypothetical protein